MLESYWYSQYHVVKRVVWSLTFWEIVDISTSKLMFGGKHPSKWVFGENDLDAILQISFDLNSKLVGIYSEYSRACD